MASLYMVSINSNNIQNIWELLEKNTKSFRSAALNLDKVIQEGGRGEKKKIGLEKLPVIELLERAKAKGVVNARQYKKDQLVAILRGKMKVSVKGKNAKK